MGYKIKLLREVKEGEKLAPQQKAIYDALLKIGVGKEVDRDEFSKDLEAAKTITTRQKTERVVAYYMQDFAKREPALAETIKPVAAPKAEKPAKDAPKGDAKSPAAAGAEAKPAKAAPASAAA